MTFVRRSVAPARWRSTRTVYERSGRRAFILVYRSGDAVDILEAVRQGLIKVSDMTDAEKKHLVDVARRKLQRRGRVSVVDGPVEDKALSPADTVRRALAGYEDGDAVEGHAKSQ